MAKQVFDAKRKDCFYFDPEQVLLITDSDHPLFDPRALQAPSPTMTASIKTNGVLQPIRVMRDETGRPVVTAGRRRVINARAANKLLVAEGLPPKLIPAMFDASKTAREAMPQVAIENALREDESIVQKAEKARRILMQGYTEDQIAEMFGVSSATIKNWTTVSELHPKVADMLEGEEIRLTDAVHEISKLPLEKQPAAARAIAEKNPTRKTMKETGQKRARSGSSPLSRLKKLNAFLDEHPNALGDSEKVLIEWLLDGEVDLVEEFPKLKSFAQPTDEE
jgi:ParB family chromosome partitioning protein